MRTLSPKNGYGYNCNRFGFLLSGFSKNQKYVYKDAF